MNRFATAYTVFSDTPTRAATTRADLVAVYGQFSVALDTGEFQMIVSSARYQVEVGPSCWKRVILPVADALGR